MLGGQLAAEAAEACLSTGDVRALRQARKRFMKDHGTVFWVLGVMQWFWYGSDRRRERFVKICEDKDVQQLTFDSYMNKQLTRQRAGVDPSVAAGAGDFETKTGEQTGEFQRHPRQYAGARGGPGRQPGGEGLGLVDPGSHGGPFGCQEPAP